MEKAEAREDGKRARAASKSKASMERARKV
jgi:hypothetical protein